MTLDASVRGCLSGGWIFTNDLGCTHDILFAEGLPAESYLDWGDRDFFASGADHALQNPDFIAPGLARRCRPVALEGPIVEAERRRLDSVFATRLVAACAWPSLSILGRFEMASA